MQIRKILILGISCTLASSLWAQSEVIENHYLVRFKHSAPKGQGLFVSSSFGDSSSLVEMVLTKKDMETLLKERASEITQLEPVYRVRTLPVEGVLIDGSAKGPDFADQWGLENPNDTDVDVNEAWKYTQGSRKIVVAVIDTGVDLTHPELINQLWMNPGEIAGDGVDNDGNGFVDDVNGYDFSGEKPDPSDDNFHGTHCAGVIAGKGVRAYGVAPGVRIMPVKFLDAGGTGSTADAIRAIDYAVQNGANVLSNSWGGGEESIELKNAIERAGAKGVLFVAAAGNDGKDLNLSKTFPAAYKLENVITVANITKEGDLHSSSNYGRGFVEIAAPGTAIFSAYPGNRYASLTGTSMATPFVSGVAALLLSLKPGLSPRDIRGEVEGSVKTNPWLADKLTTGGILSAGKAVKRLMAGSPPPPSIPPKPEDPTGPVPPKPTPPPAPKPPAGALDPKLVSLTRKVSASEVTDLYDIELSIKTDASTLSKMKTVTYYYREDVDVKKQLVESPEADFRFAFTGVNPKQKIVIVVRTYDNKYHMIEYVVK